MEDRNYKFVCCTLQKISVTRCKSCNHLFGYCLSCSTLFSNFQNPSTTSVIPRNGELTCANCQSFFPVIDVMKYQVSYKELDQAGMGNLPKGRLLIKEDANSEEDSTISGEEALETRCTKCGNKIPINVLTCDRCGFPTPLGRSSGLSSSGTTKITSDLKSASRQSVAAVKTSRKTGPPVKNQALKKSFLPKILADLPLNKVKIPTGLAMVLTVAIPIAAFAYYYFSTNYFCLDCVQVSGKYSTNLNEGGKKVRLEIHLSQYQGMVTGKVLFTPLAEPATPDAPKPPPPQQFIEIIQSGTVKNHILSFQTYVREGDSARVRFNGQFTNDSVLNGDLKVTMPEFDWIGKSFPISIKKS
jgi:hypothetical protein